MDKSEKQKPKRGRGRPTSYTQKLANEICEIVASQTMGMRRLCEKYDHWPDETTVYQWLFKYEDFAQLYARAKNRQAEIAIDQIYDIADDGHNDYVVTENGKRVVDQENIQRSRLRVDTRKWAASKLLRKKYGDHINIQQTDASGDDVTLTADERLKRINQLLKSSTT